MRFFLCGGRRLELEMSESVELTENIDIRGVRRGKCKACNCEAYNGGQAGKKCEDCGHPPGKHKNLDSASEPTAEHAIMTLDRNVAVEEKLSDLIVSSPVSIRGIEESDEVDEVEESMLVPPLVPMLRLDDEERCCYPGCNKSRYKDEDKIHPFCGRYHAKCYQAKMQGDHQVRDQEECKTPGCNNFRYRHPSGKTFDYCSKYCRDNKPEVGLPVLTVEELGECKLPDCCKPRYQDPANGRTHHFCSRSHASEAARKGITTSDSEIRLVELTTPAGQRVSTTFKNSWAPQKGKCPDISFIFSVVNTTLRQTWHRYKDGLGKPKVLEYFHGTTLECNITVQQTLCTDTACGVCGIANTGFDRRCIRKNIDFQRFGHGFYVAPNSSKCHDYTRGKHGYRAMLLFDICPGNTYVLQTDDETLTEPPDGYNSVHGQAGRSLNYDELVLYNPDGAFPKYIIVYQRDGENRIARNMKSTIKTNTPKIK